LSAGTAQQVGDVSKAVARLQMARSLAPDLPHIISQEMYLGVESGLPPAPATVASPVAQLADSAYSPGLNNGAVNLLQQGETATSFAMLEEAVRLDPMSAVTHYNLAVAAYRLGDSAAAEQALLRTVSLQPDWAYPYVYLAVLNINRNHPAAAREAAVTAIHLDPSLREAHMALLHSLLSLNDTEAGIRAAEEALQRFRQDPQFLLYQALFLRARGDDAEALAVLKTAFFAPQGDDLRRRIAEEILLLMKGE
jgi:tetratricopeptide (TPR) repeat protein